MSKINLGEQGFTPIMPMGVLGTLIDNKPNWMALGWVTRVNFKPALLGMGVNQVHATTKSLTKEGVFTVSFPSSSLITETDYVGLVSGKRADKSEVFETFLGETGVPMVKAAPLCLECKVYDIVELPTNNFVIGEIVATWSEDKYLTDGNPDVAKMDPFMLTMPDNRYWSVGAQIGRAWSDGKALKK